MNAKRKGFILIFSYLVIGVLFTLGIAQLARSIADLRVAERDRNSTAAFYLAEAGVQRALWELNYNNCAGFTPAVLSGQARSLSQSLGASGDYDVTIDSDNTEIIGIGYYPSKTSTTARMIRVVRINIGNDSVFKYAAFARNSINMSNNARTDSYDSAQGNYGGANVGANGDIGTNGTSAGAITMTNNAKVYGDASTGPGGTIVCTNNSEVVPPGTTSSSNNLTVDSVVVPDSLTSLPASSSIDLTNNSSQTLSSGTYKLPSISISNNSTLTIDGAVEIYLTDSATAFNIANNGKLNLPDGSQLTVYIEGVFTAVNNGKINNVEKSPSNFIIYSKYSGNNGIQIANNVDVYGAIYAPDTTIALPNNTSIFGAVVGKTISFTNNSKVHYDEALGALGGGNKYLIRSWQEI